MRYQGHKIKQNLVSSKHIFLNLFISFFLMWKLKLYNQNHPSLQAISQKQKKKWLSKAFKPQEKQLLKSAAAHHKFHINLLY